MFYFRIPAFHPWMVYCNDTAKKQQGSGAHNTVNQDLEKKWSFLYDYGFKVGRKWFYVSSWFDSETIIYVL